MTDIKKAQAYRTVFNDLCECRMFQGHYDAINGNPYFMSGIETVMEVIAQRGHNEEFAEKFSEAFAFNVERSKNNV